MKTLRTLDQAGDLKGKRVLLRVDLNLPVLEGKINDYARVEQAIPTISFLSSRGARIILCSHFGRPGGMVDQLFSLRPVQAILERMIGKKVGFVDDCVGSKVQEAVSSLSDGDILLLENIRFHSGEEKNDSVFSAQLASNSDIFVNDAFSVSHRAHSSTEGIACLIPSYAGLAMSDELKALQKIIGNPVRPVIAIVGGSKISTKIGVLSHLVTKVDCLVIGGGMANTFLAAQGIGVGRSLCEHDLLDIAGKVISDAEKASCRLILPVDGLVAKECASGVESRVFSIDDISSDGMILDVGPQTVGFICEAIDHASTLVWNGPLGVFEIPPFDQGTLCVARHIALRTKAGKLVSVAGGGDTLSALRGADVLSNLTYVSTAGGAFLEWMEGRSLPGVEVLSS